MIGHPVSPVSKTGRECDGFMGKHQTPKLPVPAGSASVSFRELFIRTQGIRKEPDKWKRPLKKQGD